MTRPPATVAPLPALLVVFGSDMSSLAGDLALSSINAGETLSAPHFLTPFPRLLALPPESAAVAWHSISGAY